MYFFKKICNAAVQVAVNSVKNFDTETFARAMGRTGAAGAFAEGARIGREMAKQNVKNVIETVEPPKLTK